ncbi:MAG TPA: 3-deoxy-manno-octulosonate cytidylyltransferase [Chitinophagales bacterium]|nr:3-deoxy-manno-octulosonate cytidylyltransferase [Chitinophagales bacterium]
MKFIGIIPSRYHSTRFPGKPLAMIGGKTMIFHVYHQAARAKSLSELLVATDDERVFHVVKSFGGNAVLTSAEHRNGTERCAEALSVALGDYEGVINIQGDEPFIHPVQIDWVAQSLKEGAEIATLVKRISSIAEYKNDSVVKVVTSKKGEALYFSRASLPFARNITEDIFKEHVFYKHIGIYGYTASVLKSIASLAPTPLEQLESLEQLRWLEHGFKIKVKETTHESHAVDTPEDLEKILKSFPAR